MEAVSNGLLHELGRDSRVNTARDGANDLCAVSHKMSDADNLLLDEILHDPVGLRSADVDGKVAQNLSAAGCVLQLGVELYT